MSQKLKDSIDILEHISEHTDLKRVGSEWRGPCPIHGGDGDNLAVNPSKRVYKCHTCGSGGSVIDFEMERLGMEYREALVHLGGEEYEYEDVHRDTREALEVAQELHMLGDATSYMEPRGFDEQWWVDQGVGSCEFTALDLRREVERRGINPRELQDTGLINRHGNLHLRGRVTFPIFDSFGRLCAFSGRGGSPKWLHTPNSHVYTRSTTLYGIDSLQGPSVFLVEGISDALALRYMGVDAVACLGTAFTEGQAELLSMYAGEAYVMFDQGALSHSFDAADKLLARGVVPLIAYLPDERDPGDLVGHMEVVEASKNSAVDVISDKIRILKDKGLLQGISNKKKSLDKIMGSLRRVPDDPMLEMYSQIVADEFNVRVDTIMDMARSSDIDTVTNHVASGDDRSLEAVALGIMRSDHGKLEQLLELGVSSDDFNGKVNQNEFDRVLDGYESGESELPKSQVGTDSWDWVYTKMRDRAFSRRIKELSEELPVCDDKMSLLREMTDLRKEMR